MGRLNDDATDNSQISPQVGAGFRGSAFAVYLCWRSYKPAPAKWCQRQSVMSHTTPLSPRFVFYSTFQALPAYHCCSSLLCHGDPCFLAGYGGAATSLLSQVVLETGHDKSPCPYEAFLCVLMCFFCCCRCCFCSVLAGYGAAAAGLYSLFKFLKVLCSPCIA
jgi:hypothetical protein